MEVCLFSTEENLKSHAELFRCVQDYGGKIDSLDQYDEMLNQWGDMMEEGDFAGVLSMLEHRLPKVSGIPPLDEIIQRV